MQGSDYVIYEKPVSDLPTLENPTLDNPMLESPTLDNPTQLNTKITNTKKQNTDLSNTHSILSADTECEADVEKTSAPIALEPKEPKRNEITLAQMNRCRGEVKERIDYDRLKAEYPHDSYLDDMVELMVETLCSAKRNIRVAGDELPAEAVKSRLMQIDGEIVEFVLDCLKMNTTKIKNIKHYLLTTLYNAPVTIGSHFTSLVNHDLYGADG